ncbi:DUF742 domain-containing protein [Actinocorallia populi]|uniref:DUF742 domain-containing protein n=1 Tax=Actinocorallia populi TaxID=2079200 RepID=UPI000D08BB4C|nr:DUF742 domain-containing protein [Actinocorallia populi]
MSPPPRHPWARGFVLVGGRTTTRWRMLVHTLVSSTGEHPPAAAGPHPEARALYLRVLAGPQSVAELSASCGVPLGVTRVLLGDLAGRGLVTLHADTDPFSPHILERLLDGLRAL